MLHSALFLLLFAVPLIAQTTWGGLKFGMTEAEVSSVMKDQIEATGFGPGTQFYAPFKIKSVTVGPATGVGTLRFDVKKKTLQGVWLDLYPEHDPAVHKLSTSEAGSRVVVYDYVAKQLLEKYGRPVNEAGRCPTRDEAIEHLVMRPLDTIKCTRLWREPSQTIEMKFSFVGVALFLTVEYKSRSTSPSEL